MARLTGTEPVGLMHWAPTCLPRVTDKSPAVRWPPVKVNQSHHSPVMFPPIDDVTLNLL